MGILQDGCEAGGFQLNSTLRNTGAAIRIVIAGLYRTAVTSRSTLGNGKGKKEHKKEKRTQRKEEDELIIIKIKRIIITKQNKNQNGGGVEKKPLEKGHDGL